MFSGTPRVTITARVAKETKERLEQLRAEGFPTGQLIDKWVEGFQIPEE